MTKALDVALRKVVKSVAQSLGVSVVVTVVTAGTYSTATGGATDTTASTTINAFEIKAADLDGFGLAKVGERFVLIPALSLATEPVATQDFFTLNSIQYAIVQVDPIRVRDLNACYIVQGSGAA